MRSVTIYQLPYTTSGTSHNQQYVSEVWPIVSCNLQLYSTGMNSLPLSYFSRTLEEKMTTKIMSQKYQILLQEYIVVGKF